MFILRNKRSKLAKNELIITPVIFISGITIKKYNSIIFTITAIVSFIKGIAIFPVANKLADIILEIEIIIKVGDISLSIAAEAVFLNKI